MLWVPGTAIPISYLLGVNRSTIQARSKKAQGWPADPGYDMGMDRNPGWVIKLVEVKGKAEWTLSQVKQPSAFGSSKKKKKINLLIWTANIPPLSIFSPYLLIKSLWMKAQQSYWIKKDTHRSPSTEKSSSAGRDFTFEWTGCSHKGLERELVVQLPLASSLISKQQRPVQSSPCPGRHTGQGWASTTHWCQGSRRPGAEQDRAEVSPLLKWDWGGRSQLWCPESFTSPF